tara:strand:+ start:98 stop:361 length:264 start_codon:yes stop_codon:yes gene_type:complete
MARNFTVNSPKGWWQDPNGKWTIHFEESNSDSSSIDPMINIDMWKIMPNGAPSKFHSRRKSSLESSLETLNQLFSSGWTAVSIGNLS